MFTVRSRMIGLCTGLAMSLGGPATASAQCQAGNCLFASYSTPLCTSGMWLVQPLQFDVPGGSSSLTFQAAGGNTGCYERITLTVPNAPPSPATSSVFLPVLMNGATYNPSVSGALPGVNYFEDSISFGGAPSTTCVLRQGGVFYTAHARRLGSGFASWTSQCILNLVQYDFTRVLGPATSHPNFSATGGNIEFGFIRGISTGAGGLGYSAVSGIDNVRIEILGQPPSNDNCGGCISLQIPSVVDINNSCCATSDGSCSCDCGPGPKDVWYCITPKCDDPITINTCGTGFDTVLSVHDDCPGTVANQVTPGGCNDDATTGPCAFTTQSELTFTPTPCTTYYIRVAGCGTDCGGVVLSVQQPHSVPINNNCANALPITGNVSFQFTNCGATTDGPAGCGAQNDVWYRYTAPCTGYVRVNTAGSPSLDTVVAVYCGTCAGLTQIDCNDYGCDPDQIFACFATQCAGTSSFIKFFARSGVQYLIRVGGLNGDRGIGRLSVSCAAQAPDNNLCANAIPVSASSVTYGTTMNATATTGATCCFPTSPDVWYAFTPPCAGSYTINLCEPNRCGITTYDTVLGVYRDCSGSFASQVICNDDFCGPTGLQSLVTFTATECVTYYIRVSGYGGATGDFTMNVSPPTGCVPPSNDNCAPNSPILNAGTTAIGTGGATNSGTIGGVTIFNDEWYRYCVPAGCSGLVSVSTCGSPAGVDSSIAVYSGSCAAGLTLVVANDNAGTAGPCPFTTLSYLTFNAAANTCYYIRVGSPVNGVTFCGRLTIIGPNPTYPDVPAGRRPAADPLVPGHGSIEQHVVGLVLQSAMLLQRQQPQRAGRTGDHTADHQQEPPGGPVRRQHPQLLPRRSHHHHRTARHHDFGRGCLLDQSQGVQYGQSVPLLHPQRRHGGHAVRQPVCRRRAGRARRVRSHPHLWPLPLQPRYPGNPDLRTRLQRQRRRRHHRHPARRQPGQQRRRHPR